LFVSSIIINLTLLSRVKISGREPQIRLWVGWVVHAFLGAYDAVNILEASDNRTIARVALELGSKGALNTTTFAALSVDEFISALKKKK